MSDTPRSDEESFSIDRLGVWRYAPDGGYTKASFSRRLERENAALREENRKAHDMACEDAVERYRLNGENAALREDSELLNFLLLSGSTIKFGAESASAPPSTSPARRPSHDTRSTTNRHRGSVRLENGYGDSRAY